jgi:ribose-phosphate pyrophosphokinase
VAIVHKTRLSGENVAVRGITGEVRDRMPVIVDDMISTGGTIAAAIQAVLAAGARPEITVVTSHALLVGPAAARLRAAPVQRLIATDSVARSEGVPLPLQTITLAPLLSEAIERLHRPESLSDLILHE